MATSTTNTAQNDTTSNTKFGTKTETQTDGPNVPGVDFEAAAQRIRDLNEQVIEQAKKSGTASIDAYEKALESVLDFEKKAADASQLDFVKALADAHVNFVSQTSEAYLKAARELLK